MKSRKIPFILSGVSLAILLASCGGGGGTDTTSTTTATTSSVSGTVPGTLIEAFCADGTYYKVNSTENGSTQHPFTLALPTGVDCRLVMTTNENDPVNRVVTAIELNANGVISGLMNLNGDIDLGYVPLSIDPINDPIDDDNSDGVKDTPLRVTLTSTSTKVTARSVSYDPMDSDNDGIPNVYEDDDSDSVSNHYDSDYLTSRPADDRDGDGVNDTYDRDDDNDGLTDDRDDDDDNDGIKDSDDDDHDDSHETTTTTTTTGPVQNYSVVNGRLLVSQCAQCHGTNGRSVTSWDSIAGEGNELASEMFDDEPIMTAQAHGYSSAEISAMASWLGGLSNVSGVDSDGDDD
jgi:hypothetical protein